MDWDLFIGRFHPLVVHFPVALLVIAALMQIASRFPIFKPIAGAIPFLVFFGTFTALISMIFGWLIAGDRGYHEGTLFWHRWLGVSVFLVGVVLCLISAKLIRVGKQLKVFLFVLMFFIVSLTGHLGGALTHGENYLSEYAPEFIRKFVQSDQSGNVPKLNPNPDSVVVFRDLITPMLTTGCMPCHDNRQRKGGLDLSTIEGIQKGGDNGLVIVPGKSGESELFRRISLPANDPKFMPVRKTPMSYGRVSIIKWWIDTGASFEETLTATSPEDIRDFLIREFNYDPVIKSYYEITTVESAAPDIISELITRGFNITPLSNESNYLAVSCRQPNLSIEQLRRLLAIKEQVTWLDVSDKNITDEHLDIITAFPNLTKLNIHSNPVTNAGIAKLKAAKHLEILNLYNTDVDDEAVEAISSLPSIKRIFIWQTNLSAAGVKSITNIKATLQVDTGYQFVD